MYINIRRTVLWERAYGTTSVCITWIWIRIMRQKLRYVELHVCKYSALGNIHWALLSWGIRTLLVSYFKILANFDKTIGGVSTWNVTFNVLNNRLLKFYPYFRKRFRVDHDRYSINGEISHVLTWIVTFRSPIFFFTTHASQRKHIFLLTKTNHTEIS
jgi:hypothetical protein